MTMHVAHRAGSWTLSERTLLLSLASLVVALVMAVLTTGPVWYAAMATFAVSGLWAAARITASELRL